MIILSCWENIDLNFIFNYNKICWENIYPNLIKSFKCVFKNHAIINFVIINIIWLYINIDWIFIIRNK